MISKSLLLGIVATLTMHAIKINAPIVCNSIERHYEHNSHALSERLHMEICAIIGYCVGVQ
jgi:hypothetical protein